MRTHFVKLASLGLAFIGITAQWPALAASYTPLSYDDIVAQLGQWERDYPAYAKAFDLAGQTNPVAPEPRRTIKAIQITHDPHGCESAGKRAVLFVGATHGNEWISGTVALEIARYLLNPANRDNEALQVAGMNGSINMRKLFSKCEVVIVPVLNPDGYTYSLQHPTSQWRLNRADLSQIIGALFTEDNDFTGATTQAPGNVQTVAGAAGQIGVDLNWNGSHKWNPAIRATNNPTNSAPGHYYRGSAPGSEPEVLSFGDLFSVKFENVRANIFYHSFGGTVLYPWGYAQVPIADTERFLGPPLTDAGKFKEHAAKMAALSNYSAWQSSGLGAPVPPPAGAYPVSGGLDDWAYAAHHSASFTVEVYNGNDYNPPDAGVPTVVNENIRSAMYLIDWAASDLNKAPPYPKP